MAGFSKLFPFLQKFHFPPSGELLHPSEVDPEVRLTHEVFRPDIKHAIYLTTIDTSAVGAGLDIELLANPEPLPKYVSIPYQICIFQTGNASVAVQFKMNQTGSTPIDLETGLWGGLNGGAGPTINLTGDHWTAVNAPFPIPRGNQFTALFVAPAAGTVRVRSLLLQVPIETVDFLPSLGGHTGFVRTGAM